MKTKICSRCGIEKPLTDFRKDKNKDDGRSCACSACEKIGFPETMKEVLRKTGKPDVIYMLDSFGDTPMNDIVSELRKRGYRGSVMRMAAQMYIRDKDLKMCHKCNKYKPISEFYNTKQTICGATSYCKDCMKATMVEAREADKIRKEKMAEIKALADECKRLRIKKALSGC